MMGRALLILGWLATLGLLASAAYGYLAERGSPAMTPHILLAFSSSLLILFAHSWVMFYLIGTGKAIREAVEAHGLESDLIEETKRFKNESYPSLMLALGLVIAVFVLGGGAYAGALPSWIHHLLFYAFLWVQVRTLVLEGRVLSENQSLMEAIDSRLAG